MKNIKLCLDSMQYSQKLKDNREIAKLSLRLGKQTKYITSRQEIAEYAQLIGSKGQTFCPATFANGERKKSNFEQIQLFVLDFDGTITMSEIYERTEKYYLPILFAYETFSSEDGDRFRVVFLNDISVTDIRAAQIMQNALMTIFPEADENCRSVVQMYFGGKKLFYISEFLSISGSIPKMNLESLIRNMTLYLRDKYGYTNYKRKIAEFTKSNGIQLNEKGLPDIQVVDITDEIAEYDGKNLINKNLPKSSIILTDNSRNLLNKSYLINLEDKNINSYGKIKRSNYHQEYRKNDLSKISLGCKLFQEFESGNRILHHHELFGIATNLIHIASGNTLFKETLKSHSYFDERPKKYEDWNYYLYYLKNNGDKPYKPESCDRYCPYKDDCSHGTNMISTWALRSGYMEKLADYEDVYVSLEYAYNDFRQRFRFALYSDLKKIFIIKAQTALGKTKVITEEIKNATLNNAPSFRILIAVPTIELRKEISARLEAIGVEITESPSLRELKDELPVHIWEHIENLYTSGISPIPFIKKIIAQNDPDCTDLFKEYLKDLDAFNNSEGHAITTHKRLQDMNVSKYDLVIIDEDIICGSIILNKIDISFSELKKLQKKLKKTAPASAVLDKIEQVLKRSETQEFFTLPDIDYKPTDDDILMNIDIPAFCSATHFVCRKASDSNEENND